MAVNESAHVEMQPEVAEIVTDPNTLRSYRRDELLGQGTSGKCYKVTDLVSGDSFAMKVIPLYSVELEEVYQEVEIVRKLRHKNVVSFSHFFEDQQFFYIFMELCSRQTLGDILRTRGSLTDPEVRYYMRQLISGLKYIHRQGYVHRDIKLDNLFVNEKMELKIGDFGLATKLEPRNKEVCGTPCYMAPEVWKREGHGPEADVWALGCVMYQLLVGRIAFDFENFSELVQNIKEAKYIIPQNLSEAAGKLIGKIFQISPQDRPSLLKIRRHKFFTKGFTPKALPPSSRDTVPQLKAAKNPVVKFFNRLARRLFRRKRSKVEPSWEDRMESGIQVPQPVESPAVDQVQVPQPVDSPAVDQVQVPQPVDSAAVDQVQVPQPVDSPAVDQVQVPQPVDSPAVDQVQVPQPVDSAAVDQVQVPQPVDSAAVDQVQVPQSVESPAVDQVQVTQPVDSPAVDQVDKKPMSILVWSSWSQWLRDL